MVDYNQKSKDRFVDPNEVFSHELPKIHDLKARKTVIAMLNAAPEEFWFAPSAFSGKYHSPDEFGLGGQVLHTKRVFYQMMVLLCAEAPEFTDKEMDEHMCAALIHDTLAGSTGSNDHVSTIVSYYSSHLPQKILDILWWEGICNVATYHMGRWTPKALGPTEWPDNVLLHYADMIATNSNSLPILKEHDYTIRR